MKWSEEIIQLVWEKATKVDGFDDSKYRKDASGAWIVRDKYRVEHNFGWEIDHIFPVSRGGDDNQKNLRAMHYLNNRSKADDYPRYKVAVTSKGTRNEETSKFILINENTQKIIHSIYKEKMK